MSTSEFYSSGLAAQLRDALADVLEVHAVMVDRRGVVQLRGRLLLPAAEAYGRAAERLAPLGYTPVLRHVGADDYVMVLPKLVAPPERHPWLGPLLFALTVLSTLFTGTLMAGWDFSRGLPPNPLIGAPFAATLLGILGAHELGHYFVGRHFKVPVSLPYFIPMPLSALGTMGAVIRLKAPPTNRRVLLAIAVAGPLAGLAVALPLLLLGLRLSTVAPIPGPGSGAMLEGNSLLYALLKRLVFGRWLPGGGLDVNLHPVAFAAWAGLFVTGLNLIPVGQLDGGHALYSLIGTRARYLTLAITAALVLLGWLVWPGWFLWAGLVFVFGQTFATPLDDITRLDAPRVLLALAMLVLLVLTFTPVPLLQL